MKTVLLTGGKSSRMGSAKHELTLNGKTFLQLLADEMKQAAPLVISAAKSTVLSDTDDPVIYDMYDSIGPINALYSTLTTLNDSILCAPCDQPLIKSRHFIRLMELDNTEADALILTSKGKAYPTIGIYHTSCIPYLQQAINQHNYKLMLLLSKMNVLYIEAETIGLSEHELLNINTPEDYEKLLKTVRV